MLKRIAPYFAAVVIGIGIAVAASSYSGASDGCCGSMGEAHAKHAEPAAAPTTQAAQKYVCPMHPEVTSDKSGKCPKCGMDLVLRKQTTQPSQDQPAPGHGNGAISTNID